MCFCRPLQQRSLGAKHSVLTPHEPSRNYPPPLKEIHLSLTQSSLIHGCNTVGKTFCNVLYTLAVKAKLLFPFFASADLTSMHLDTTRKKAFHLERVENSSYFASGCVWNILLKCLQTFATIFGNALSYVAEQLANACRCKDCATCEATFVKPVACTL